MKQMITIHGKITGIAMVDLSTINVRLTCTMITGGGRWGNPLFKDVKKVELPYHGPVRLSRQDMKEVGLDDDFRNTNGIGASISEVFQDDEVLVHVILHTIVDADDKTHIITDHVIILPKPNPTNQHLPLPELLKQCQLT